MWDIWNLSIHIWIYLFPCYLILYPLYSWFMKKLSPWKIKRFASSWYILYYFWNLQRNWILKDEIVTFHLPKLSTLRIVKILLFFLTWTFTRGLHFYFFKCTYENKFLEHINPKIILIKKLKFCLPKEGIPPLLFLCNIYMWQNTILQLYICIKMFLNK